MEVNGAKATSLLFRNRSLVDTNGCNCKSVDENLTSNREHQRCKTAAKNKN